MKMWFKTQMKAIQIFLRNNWKTILTIGFNKFLAWLNK